MRLASSSRTSLSATRLLAMLGNLQWGCDVTATVEGGAVVREGGWGCLTSASSRTAMSAAVQECIRTLEDVMEEDELLIKTRPTDGIDWILLLPTVSAIC